MLFKHVAREGLEHARAEACGVALAQALDSPDDTIDFVVVRGVDERTVSVNFTATEPSSDSGSEAEAEAK